MRRDELLLIDMLRAAKAVELFVAGVAHEALIADDMRRTAVQKKLEIMGEAARHVSEDLKQRHLEVPWAQMTGLRNYTIHQYFRSIGIKCGQPQPATFRSIVSKSLRFLPPNSPKVISLESPCLIKCSKNCFSSMLEAQTQCNLVVGRASGKGNR